MELCLSLARSAASRGEVAVGALVTCENKIIATGSNHREALDSPQGHAELVALHKVTSALGNWRLRDCTIYSTLEPCLMCTSTLLQAQIGRVVFGSFDLRAGGFGGLLHLDETSTGFRPWVTSGVLAPECRAEIQKFFSGVRASVASR